ncbi:MAG: NAD(P)-dependent oxidoreductase [Aurantibacter sp.]
MQVIVFGATGTIGKNLIEQALKEGHEVTAFCRDGQKLNEFKHPRLSIVEGDVLNQTDVTQSIKGQEVVFVALGSGKKRKSSVRSAGTKNIIEGMRANGVKRLICQSTLGAGESQGNLNFFWKHIMFGWYLKNVFQDHELQEKYVMQSNLDWTIARPGAFSDGALTGNYRHGFPTDDRSVKLKISRADVADFLLKLVPTDSYLHQTPGLSY